MSENGTFTLVFDSAKIRKLPALTVAQFISAVGRYTDDPVGAVTIISDVLARTVETCPTDWGKPDQPETYMQLSWFTDFQEAARQLSTAVNAAAKN